MGANATTPWRFERLQRDRGSVERVRWAGGADAIAFVLGKQNYLGLLSAILYLQEEASGSEVGEMRMHNKEVRANTEVLAIRM
jgi:hypothetical protein